MAMDWTLTSLRRDFGLPTEPSKVESIEAARSKKLSSEALEVAKRGGNVEDFLRQRVASEGRGGGPRDSRRP
jgi:hypothetical protein